ncbi:LysR family transcriptional regulator [Achromobacter sp. UMC46]|uniref:LysR family transcriptional regulator n=1 Tax=Achromobacter sp. UMC46 TaxID=1862319 RepID=UPI0016028C07|nr:LysR family transcriptional regulator [Achromobacter sp. UMC46]MBB1593308.1 LysR family transcriptional regulator [Achromobacter sp. UMC46]
MDTRWLQDFITLTELRNFTRAAEARNLSQAAFSRRIQSLEQWAGARLIDRSTFPTQLTESGERFRLAAMELVNQLAEARAGIGGVPARNQLRLATSYSLATAYLPDWWIRWSAGQHWSCQLQTGNVHDTVSAFTSGAADLLICFHQVTQPLPLDTARYERLELCTELIRPYAARTLLERTALDLPGTAGEPVPLLMYSPNVYFARLIEAAIEGAEQPVHGVRVFEAEMSDVLGDMAAQGLGVAWLADSALRRRGDQALAPVANRAWDVEVSVLAFKEAADTRPVVSELWEKMRTLTAALPLEAAP